MFLALKFKNKHYHILQNVLLVYPMALQSNSKRLARFFSSITDGYTDPDHMIRQKREQRLQREKMIRLEQEKKRQEILEKKRFRLPKIIVTQYFDYFETLDEPRAQSSNNEAPSTLPNLVDIPCDSESEKTRGEGDTESQGSKGDRLELPDLKVDITKEGGYFEDLAQVDGKNESLLFEHKNQEDAPSIIDVNDSNSQEIDRGADVGNVSLEDGSEKILKGDVSPSEVAIEPESNPVSKSVNTKIDELNNPRTEHENITETEKESIPKTELEPLDICSTEQNERYNAANENGEGEIEGNESDRRIEEKESEEEIQKKESEIKIDNKESEIEQGNAKKEMQMNFLSPPAVVADENFSNHESIGDADDTGNFEICYTTDKFTFL